MRPRLLSALVAAALTATFALAGCAIGEQQGVNRIDPDDLNGLDLTVPSLPASADTTEAPTPSSTPAGAASTTGAPATLTGLVPATMYFIEGDTLVAVTVEVPELSARGYLQALETGPPQSAIEEGIRSAIPPGLISSVDIGLDSITVGLDGEVLATVDTQDQPNLIAQIVLSLTDLPDYPGTDHDLPAITRVRFTLDGAPLPVPRRDNTLTEPGEYVTRLDYEQLLTPGAVSATTSGGPTLDQ